MFIPDSYDNFIMWIQSYHQGRQILQATGMDNTINKGFVAKMNKEHTGFHFLIVDQKKLTKGEIILDDIDENKLVTVKTINLKDIIGVECSLSNYYRDFIGSKYQRVQYSISVRNENKFEFLSEDYVIENNQKFMEIGSYLMNSTC